MNTTTNNHLPADGFPLMQNTEAAQLPVQVEVGGKQYSFAIWDGQKLPDSLLAYDTETALIQDREIPQLAMATVHGNQGSCYFIHPGDLSRFVLMHQAAYWVCHNAAFDFWVTQRVLEEDPQVLAMWWDIAGSGRLLCTMLLDNLIDLGRIDARPISRNLGTVAAEYCPGLSVNKDDPYRLRYGELVGLPSAAWKDIEHGFLTYAAMDPVATLQVAQKQFLAAQGLIRPNHEPLLPDAIRRFGPLTNCIQVMGAIALDYVSRHGISVDLELATSLHDSIAALVEEHRDEMERLLPGSFKRHGPRSDKAGELQLTPAGVPRRNAKAIKQELERISAEVEQPLRPTRNKDGLVTDAVAYWKQHRGLHPFVAAYTDYSEQAKLSQFFKKLDQSTIYPRYSPLMRTGRTSCSKPNLQQLPRDPRFREMIIAPVDYSLLQIDYSVLELRTLAQVCLQRYGRSVLADLFRQGVDPHKYTAALLLDLSPEQFAQLPVADQKKHRQCAKAVNFGVPGGLGVDSLVDYANKSFDAELTVEQAREFRQKMITEVYPEIKTYLSDNQYADIAINLGTSEDSVRRALPSRGQVAAAERIVAGENASPEGDVYLPGLVNHVWAILQQLNNNPELARQLFAKRSSNTLMRQIFFGGTMTLSGRLRGHVGYTQRANSPFQGLAADGNKLALFRLVQAGFRVCGFIHDEALMLIPDSVDYTTAVEQVQQIMADAMQEMTPDIPIATEYLLADRWYKDVDEQPVDDEGGIVPYVRKIEC